VGGGYEEWSYGVWSVPRKEARGWEWCCGARRTPRWGMVGVEHHGGGGGQGSNYRAPERVLVGAIGVLCGGVVVSLGEEEWDGRAVPLADAPAGVKPRNTAASSSIRGTAPPGHRPSLLLAKLYSLRCIDAITTSSYIWRDINEGSSGNEINQKIQAQNSDFKILGSIFSLCFYNGGGLRRTVTLQGAGERLVCTVELPARIIGGDG